MQNQIVSASAAETRPGCPDWCRGHRDYEQGPTAWLSHHSPMEFTGDRITVTVNLMYAENYGSEPVVMVMRHDEQEAVYVTQTDAAKWATILDGAGATELAAAIRTTLARVGRVEITLPTRLGGAS